MIAVRCPECNKFLFEAVPDPFSATIIVKCRCANYVQVTDPRAPAILDDYQSANQKVFRL